MTTWNFPSVDGAGIILILGLGETGVAAARWCAARGARLRVADTRTRPPGMQALLEHPATRDAEFRFGPDALAVDVLDGVATLVLSPGLSPLGEPVQSLVTTAMERGIEVVGEIELFARALNDLANQGYTPKVLAVTGTNGKTTVTAMTRQLAQASGFTVMAAGNIGPAALAALDTAIESDTLPDVWVLELSSFQLATTRSLNAHAATVLNVSQDHIDWHGSFPAYIDAKAALLKQAEIRIINRDDAVVRSMVSDVQAAAIRSFGSDTPVLDGDLGLDGSQGMDWLCAAVSGDDSMGDAPAPRRRSSAAVAAEAAIRAPGLPTRLMPVDALRVRGRHNALNAQAAMILVRTLGAGWAAMLHALRDYCGEPHRMEFVRTVAGVDFINDSKGTNVGASVAALEGLRQQVILIAGGLAKGQDFAPLATAAADRVRAAILLGQDAAAVAAALDTTGVPLDIVASMEEAVTRAFKLARPGDAVLLSPACASMDMFQNYGHRGQCFVDAVTELALDQGEVA